MKITIERAALAEALGRVANAAAKRGGGIAILAHVLMDAADGELALRATDMDIAITDRAQADVATPGTAVVPAQLAHDIVRKLPDVATIKLETGEPGRMTLQSGRSTFRLPCLDAADFPTDAADELPHGFALDAAVLRTMLDRTRFAASTEETRYYLNGIYIHSANAPDPAVQVLRAVATDGHRLALTQTPMPEGGLGMPGVILPNRAITELRRLLEDVAGAVDVSLSEARMRFAVGTAVITTKLIDGTFPDYQRVIPADNDKMLGVDRGKLTAAVDLVSTISSEKSRAIKLAADAGALRLSAAGDTGDATDEVDAVYTDKPIEVGFNSRYLLEIARQIEGDNTTFGLADATSPAVIRDDDDDSTLYVLMPMRV